MKPQTQTAVRIRKLDFLRKASQSNADRNNKPHGWRTYWQTIADKYQLEINQLQTTQTV